MIAYYRLYKTPITGFFYIQAVERIDFIGEL
jgi:hypothetical protein